MLKTLTTALLLAGAQVLAADAPVAETPLEEIVVTGEYAGPGMWKITQPDHADHVLWIVGEPPPLPKRLTWRSEKVERVLLQSQEVLRQAGVQMKPDEKIGVLKGITLLPGLRKARKNPDEGTLQDHVPPESYQRWLVQKKLYLGRDEGVEKLRPIVAARELRKAAFDKLKLRESGMIWDELDKLVRKNKIPVNAPLIVLTFPADEVRDTIKQMQKEEIADADCFAKSLDLTEMLANKTVEEERARAWATGDVEKLASLPTIPPYAWACISALLKAQTVSEFVPEDIAEQVNVLWVDTAGQLLAKNKSTLSVVALTWLLEPNGLLDRLRNRGYTIEAPAGN